MDHLTPRGEQTETSVAASNDFNRWRAKAIQAKRHRVAELARVKAKLRELNAQQVGSEDFRKYRDLRRAVQAHQAATLSGDYEPTPHDHLLWQAAYVEADPGEVA